MANCKKCGAELSKTNKIFSVVENSEASKNLSKGDVIVSVDEKTVKSLADIEKAIPENKACKITIMHDEQRKSVSIETPIEYFKSVEFESENVCSKCGAKQKGNKTPFILGIIIFIVLIVLILLLVPKRNKQNTNSASTQNEAVTTKTKNVETTEEYKYPRVEVLTEQQKEKVETDIDKKMAELHPNGNTEEPRYEVISEEEFNDDDFNIEIQKELKELYDKFESNDTDDEDSPFSGVSSGGPSEKESKGGPGLGENKTKSDKLASDKAVRIYFDYGSYLNTKNISMANYLRGNQDIETSADIEYAQFYLAIDDLIKSIPENKRNKATFAVVGYADTSFRNGISDKGVESKKFNTELSLKRAEAVVKMLISESNINADKILPPKGRGFEKLIRNREDGKENHERSRRVEVFCCYAD